MCVRRMFAVGMVVSVVGLVSAAKAEGQAGSVPILYTTDLYHPHADPDDHFDLATLFALREFDIRGIVLDLGKPGANRPGIVPLKQMMHITGRNVPFAPGLKANLRSPEDRAEQQPAADQGGVRLIIETLRESREPITIFTAGSLRDVAAAYNREPGLFREKVGRLYINIGHSGGKKEYNVEIGRHAYVRIMRSGLNIYWVPCFGTQGYESLWRFRHDEVLETAPPAVQNFFIYALTKASPSMQDPIAALSTSPSPDVKAKIWAMERKMWCTGAFLHAAGRTDASFSFKPLTVKLNEKGRTTIVPKGEGLKLLTFHREDAEVYGRAMLEQLRALLAGLK